jgi:uncharacterized protein involved in cysteine biosynthesis
LSFSRSTSWLASALSLIASFGLLFFSFYLLPSISMLVSGLFVDEVAEKIERINYSEEPVGVPMSLGRSLKEGVRFGLLTLGVNLVALMLLLLPGGLSMPSNALAWQSVVLPRWPPSPSRPRPPPTASRSWRPSPPPRSWSPSCPPPPSGCK